MFVVDDKEALLAEISDDERPVALITSLCTLLRGIFDSSTGAGFSLRISPPSFFDITRASFGSRGPMFCLILSSVPGSRVFDDLNSSAIGTSHSLMI